MNRSPQPASNLALLFEEEIFSSGKDSFEVVQMCDNENCIAVGTHFATDSGDFNCSDCFSRRSDSKVFKSGTKPTSRVAKQSRIKNYFATVTRTSNLPATDNRLGSVHKPQRKSKQTMLTNIFESKKETHGALKTKGVLFASHRNGVQSQTL